MLCRNIGGWLGACAALWMSVGFIRAQSCALETTSVGEGQVVLPDQATDPSLRIQVGSLNADGVPESLVLETSRILVRFGHFTNANSGIQNFEIRDLFSKSAPTQDMAGSFMGAGAGLGTLSSIEILSDAPNKKTVRVEWNRWNVGTQTLQPTQKIIRQYSIYPHGTFIEIDYVDMRWAVNIADWSRPGGTTSGEHVAYGFDGWIRGYVTHHEGDGLFYSRYAGDGLFDPADGGSLSYNGNFIIGVFNPANGHGFARVSPVEHTHVIKLLHTPTQRLGLEFQHYPFLQPTPRWTGYLYVVTGGAAEIIEKGQALTDRLSDAHEVDCGTPTRIEAIPDPGWDFAQWSGDVSGTDNPLSLTPATDLDIVAHFERGSFTFFEDFEGYALGADPADWLDTQAGNSLLPDDALFEVADPGGTLALATSSDEINIHSHYVAAGSDAMTDYEFSGRIMTTGDGAGVGFTVLSQFPSAGAYYRVRRFGSDGSFHISPLGTSMTGGTTDTGVVPLPNVWYRFRARANDTGGRTEISVKIWEDGTPQPDFWLAEAYDDSPTRLATGTVGLWSAFSGGPRYFDELMVAPIERPHPPTARDDPYLLAASGGTLTVSELSGVLANDFDANGDPLTASLVSGPSHGTLTLEPDGSFVYTNTDAAEPIDSFQYEVDDGSLSAIATATIYIGSARVTADLIALYGFVEEGGDLVHDLSGVDPPMTLEVRAPAVAMWLAGGGMSIDSDAGLVSPGPATRITDAIQVSQQFTVEAWVRPGNLTQFGSARTVALSVDSFPNGANFILGQDTTKWDMRVRDSSTNQYGVPSLATGDVVTMELQHVVYTRSATGDTRLYVNGLVESNASVAGTLSNWDSAARLALANEPLLDRPWLGELHLVAIYDRALSPAEVDQNFLSGPDISSAALTSTLNVTVSGNGSTVQTPDQAEYDFGEEVTIEAVPDPGWAFTGWSGDIESAENPLILAMAGDVNVTANFSLITLHSLTLQQIGNGAVSADPDLASYTIGQEVTITAAPDSGWLFQGWSGDFVSSDSVATLVITGDMIVTATFSDQIFADDFGAHAPGDDPAGWLDTAPGNSLDPDDSAFAIFDVGGDLAFGTSSTQINIHSHYVGPGATDLASYRYSGRMMITSATGGVGVTFYSGFPDSATYYRLRRYGTNAFHLSPLGTTMTGGNLDSGVVPAPGNWYRFTIEVEDTGVRTEIRARVWLDGTPEPTTWPIDAFDDGGSRRIAGTFGTWSYSHGSKYWDDLSVELLYPVGTPLPLDVSIVGLGAVTKDPDAASYAFGDEVTLTATPDSDAFFAGWTGDFEGLENPATITMAGPREITASFAPATTHSIDVTAVGNGTVAKNPDATEYVFGASVSLTATADPGWLFAGWSGDIASGSNPLDVIVDGDLALVATFVEITTHSVATSVVGEGTVTRAPDQAEYLLGEVVTLTAVPEPGWTFSEWLGDVGGSDSSVDAVVTGDLSVTAVFRAVAYAQDFEASPVGSGPSDWYDSQAGNSLAEDPSLFGVMDLGGNHVFATTSTDINIHSHFVGEGSDEFTGYDLTGRMRMTSSSSGIGVTVFGQFPGAAGYYRLRRYEGTTVRLSPLGTLFTGGTVDTGVDMAPGVWYRVRLRAEDTGVQTEVRAKIWPDGDVEPETWQAEAFDDSVTRHTRGTIGVWSMLHGTKMWDDLTVELLTTPRTDLQLGVTTSGDGSVTKNPDQIEYAFGDEVELTAVPAAGFYFSGWSGSVEGTENPATITMLTDVSVTATFLPQAPQTVTLLTTGAGSATKSPDLPEYLSGDVVTLTATPDPGSVFVGWSGDVTGTTNPIDVVVTADLVVTAEFSTVHYQEDFTSFAVGSDPALWVDTSPFNSLTEDDTLFEVTSIGGDNALATSSTSTNIHSHYTGPELGALASYELTGRMRMASSDGGVGVTFFSSFPSSATYYRLRRYGSTAFHVVPFGTLMSGGTTDTGVVPSPNTWYRFKISVEALPSETRIRAKVWEDGSTEPATWQANCFDDSASRLTSGTIGVWSFSSGSKYWDDLRVTPLTE